jgi:predicted alpha/beta-hydrolase family hydrolase
MTHPFIDSFASGLRERAIASLRFQFPYMEAGLKRPDPPILAQAAIRAAVAKARLLFPGLALVAGGKSFGGRMTSQAAAASPMPGLRGIGFLGFPLHPPGRPSLDRAEHLRNVRVPMLFLQGTRDRLADVALMAEAARQLGDRATLRLLEGADHSFHAPGRNAHSDAEIQREMLDAFAVWVENAAARSPGDGGKRR